MILYGSRALKNLYPDFKREPFDTDWLLSAEEYKPNNLRLHKIGAKKDVNGGYTEFCRIPVFDRYVDYETGALTANQIYTLKMSHIFWDIKWSKHIYDIQFLQSKGCELIADLFTELYEYWNQLHKPNWRVDFEKDNEDFFKDAVRRKYNHDDLHEIVKVHEKPMFMYIKDDLNKAAISEDLFNKLDLQDKFLVVQEEACVLAYERYILNGVTGHYRGAYSKALKDLIMRLTPLWLGVFIVQNYGQLIKPHINYKEKIENFFKNELSGNC